MAQPSNSPGSATPAEVDLLSVLAADELSAFLRLSAAAPGGPTLADVRGLAAIAVGHLDRHERVADHLAGLGVDVEGVLRPWRAGLDAFHRRMAPSTWGEVVVGAYVGDAVGSDVWAALAAGAPPATAALVASVLGPRTPDVPLPDDAAPDAPPADDAAPADASPPDGAAPDAPAPDDPVTAFAVPALARAVAADRQAAGRLSLWGRRLVGEALGQVQGVLTLSPGLEGLLGAGAPGPVVRAPVTDTFARVTRAHVARMTRVGLTP